MAEAPRPATPTPESKAPGRVGSQAVPGGGGDRTGGPRAGHQSADLHFGPVTFDRLKLIGIIAPLAFLAVLWALLHTVFRQYHRFPEILLVLVVTAAGIAIFAHALFTLVASLERRIVDQNRELERRNQDLRALLSVGRAVSSSITLDDVLSEAARAILLATEADAAEVWLQGEDGTLTFAQHHGLGAEAFRERTHFEPGEGLPGLAAKRGHAVVVHDLPRDERFLRESVKALGFHTYCALPLSHRGRTVGVFGVASRDRAKHLGDEQLGLLEGIGEQVALAVENSRLHTRVLDGAVLEERMRIARDLHDGLAQVLGYVNVQTHAVGTLLRADRTEDAQIELAAMETAVRQVYADVREEILGLRVSLPHTGLVPAVRRYLDEYQPMTDAALRLEVGDHLDALNLPASTEIQLLRIVQEALRNVRKHSAAATTVVRLAADADTLTVEVADDGIGFDPVEPGRTGWPRFGLQTMRERAQALGGRFELDAQPGRGTRVSVRLPLRPERETAGDADPAR